MTKKLFFLISLIFIISIALAGCGSKEVVINAYVGSGMIVPMEAIKETYEAQHPNVTIIYSFAGSGTLEETIRSLKQGDIYMPGDTKYIDNLSSDGLIVNSYPVAYHIPAIIVQEGNTTVTSWDDLAKEGVRISILNPDLASAGRTADNIISSSSLNEQIRANITLLSTNADSITQPLLDNEIDAIINWRSTSETVQGLVVIEIPEDVNEISEIWIAVPTHTTVESEAIAFAEFVAGTEGQKIFTDKGFLIIEK